MIKKVVLVIAVFIISACSKEEVEEVFSQDISGTWNAISFTANEPLFDVNNDGINATNLLDELPCRYSIFKLNSDKTFYQENNAYTYNQSTNTYSCTSGDALSIVRGTWKMNTDNTMLSLEINGNTAFLYIEFDGEFLKFNSSEVFLNKNANGELKNIRGSVSFTR